MTRSAEDAVRRTQIALVPSISPALTHVQDAVRQMGMDTAFIRSLLQLRRLLVESRIQMVVIDAVEPDDDGLTLCRQLRSTSGVPIIAILPCDPGELVITAINAGADDCLTPILSIAECQARIRGLLRRASFADARALAPHRMMRFAGYRLYPFERKLHDDAGLTVELTAMEFDVLLTLFRNAGRLMRREELLALTHAGLAGPTARSNDVHVRRLRQKIERDPGNPSLLKTVRLGGYILVADVIAT